MPLREWLETNKKTLAKYDIDEIAEMAMRCGFELSEVSEVLPEWHMDSLTRTTLRQRQAYHVDRELRGAEHHLCGKMDLSTHWREVWRYQEFGRCFDE